MNQNVIIARRYAKGLVERAMETGELDAVRHDLKTLGDILDKRSGERHVPEFLDFLDNPSLHHSEKIAASGKILADCGVGPTVGAFLGLLVKHNRTALLPRIIDAFAEISGEIAGEYTALVETARPLSDEQQSRLASVLSTALGGEVRLHQRVVPGLLAGARVSVGDTTIDGSVLGRLEKLKSRLVYGGET